MSNGYQGWSNYPTWCIHLWISNEEPLYRYWRDSAQDAYDGADPDPYNNETRLGNAKYTLAERLKEEWRGELGEELWVGLVGFWSDLMGYALDQVDWHEVAEALLEEVKL